MSSLGTRDYHQNLANQIIEYWARRGYAVDVTVEPMRATTQGDGEDVVEHTGWAIRSDMRCGWPKDLLARRVNDLKSGMSLL